MSRWLSSFPAALTRQKKSKCLVLKNRPRTVAGVAGMLTTPTLDKPYKDGWKYVLTIPYETDEELDRIIYDDILAEAHQIADLRNGFIEADVVAVDDPDRSW